MDTVREIGGTLVVRPGAGRSDQPGRLVPEGDLMISPAVRSSFLQDLNDYERECTQREFHRLSAAYDRLRELNREQESRYPGTSNGVGVGMLAWSVVDGGMALTVGAAAAAAARQLADRRYGKGHERLCGQLCTTFVKIAIERVTRLRDKIDRIDHRKKALEEENARLQQEMYSLWPTGGFNNRATDRSDEMRRLSNVFERAGPSVAAEIESLGGRLVDGAKQVERAESQYRVSIAQVDGRVRELRSIERPRTGERVIVDFVREALGDSLTVLEDELDLELDAAEICERISQVRDKLDLEEAGRQLSSRLFGEQVLGAYTPRIEAHRSRVAAALAGDSVDELRLRLTALMDQALAVCRRAASRQTAEALTPIWWRAIVWAGNKLLPTQLQRLDVGSALQQIESECTSIMEEWPNLSATLPPEVDASSIPSALNSLGRIVANFRSRESSYQLGLSAMRNVASLDAELAAASQHAMNFAAASSDLDDVRTLLAPRHREWVKHHPTFRRMEANAAEIEEMHEVRNALKRVHDRYRERLSQIEGTPMLWSVDGRDFNVNYLEAAGAFLISARRV